MPRPEMPSASGPRSSTQKAESRCRAMMEVGRSLTTARDIDELLKIVLDLATKLVEADRSTIFLVDRQRKQVWSKVAQGMSVQEIRLPLGAGIAGWVAQTGKTLNLKDAYEDKRFDPKVDSVTGYRTGTILCVPLHVKEGEILGVIQTLNKRGGPFSVEDERLLEAIASQVAVAVENALLVTSLMAKNSDLIEAHSDLARKVAEVDVLFQLEKEISGSHKLDAMLENMLKKAVELLPCDAGSILLRMEEASEIIFITATGSRREAVKRLRLPLGAGVVGWVAEHGKPALVNEPAKDPRHLKELEQRLDYRVRNLLAVPMVFGGKVIGAIEFLNKRAGPFESGDEKLATVMAGQAASAIHIGRDREEAERMGRLSSIGQMLSGVIHDFRTPMSIISGYVQLMAKEADGETRRAQSDVILRQFGFLNDMTKELLAFARVETNLLLQKINLAEFLADMKELLERELSLSRVTLRIEDRYGGPLRVDENKLRNLIFNLTRNAREAMPKGGEFAILVEEEPDSIRLEFSDSGPGLPAEVRERLFQSFVTCGKESGTGLGLAMVKKIVDEHGGRICAENPPGGGALFRVWLPKDSPILRAKALKRGG